MLELMEKIEERFSPDEPIFARDVLALADGAPRSTVYYQLGKAVAAGKLAKGGGVVSTIFRREPCWGSLCYPP